MTRPYPYQPGKYEASKGKHSGLEMFYSLARRRWKFTGLGTWVVRNARGRDFLSVHATGNACDLGYLSSNQARMSAVQACDWFVEHNFKLGVVAIHDYSAPGNPRAWRCDRGTWETFSKGELGPGGRWIHVELEPHMAEMAGDVYAALWRSLPKPV